MQIDADGAIYVIGAGALDEVLAATYLRNSGSVIDKERILTHGEAADNEDGMRAHAPYGPRTTCERWDLEYLGMAESPVFNPWATNGSRGGDVLRGKVQYYRERGY